MTRRIPLLSTFAIAAAAFAVATPVTAQKAVPKLGKAEGQVDIVIDDQRHAGLCGQPAQ